MLQTQQTFLDYLDAVHQGRDFAPIKQELGQVKKAMLAAVEQVLSSLVQDEERAAELRKAWGQKSSSKRRSQSTRRRKPADLGVARKHNAHETADILERCGGVTEPIFYREVKGYC